MARARLSRPSWRLLTVALVLGICGAGLIGRLAYLQIYKHEEYLAEAQSTHDTDRTVAASRGSILDRTGNPLATSIDTANVIVDRKVWQEEGYARRAAEKLAPALGRSPGDILAALGSETTGPAVLALGVPYEQGKAITALGLPGVIVEPASRRINPEGNLASSVLGFIGRDSAGLTGLELDLNTPLTGEPGRELFERDSLGNPIAFGSRQEQPPKPGHDVVLDRKSVV